MCGSTCGPAQNIIKKNLFIFLYIAALKSSRKRKANICKRGPTGRASKKHKSKHVEKPEEEEENEEVEEGKFSKVVYDENSDENDDEEETGEETTQKTQTATHCFIMCRTSKNMCFKILTNL